MSEERTKLTVGQAIDAMIDGQPCIREGQLHYISPSGDIRYLHKGLYWTDCELAFYNEIFDDNPNNVVPWYIATEEEKIN